MFANAVAFVSTDTTLTLDKSTLEFTTAATKTPADAVISWISSDETIATVSDAGVVTPKKTGTCKIFAVNGDVVAQCDITVTLA